jgi:hypothetical protein
MYAGPPVEIIGVLIVTAAGFIKQSSKPSNPCTTAHQSAEYSQHQVWFHSQKWVGFHKKSSLFENQVLIVGYVRLIVVATVMNNTNIWMNVISTNTTISWQTWLRLAE